MLTPLPQPMPSWPPDAAFEDLLDPCNDFVFRKLFQTHPDLLEAMVNDLRAGAVNDLRTAATCDPTTEPLHAPVPQLRGLCIGNTELLPEQLFGKNVRFDVCAFDDSGRIVLAECDARHRKGFARRVVYYLCKALSRPLRQGASYDTVRPVLALHILKFVILPQAANAQRPLSSFRLRRADGLDYAELNAGEPPLEAIVVELPKIKALWYAYLALGGCSALGAEALRLRRLLNTAAYNWALFLARPGGLTMNDITHGPTRRAILEAVRISADPLQRSLAEQQEKYLRDRQAELDEAREEGEAFGVAKGEAIGVAKGEALGAAKGRAEILGKLLQLRFATLPDWASQAMALGTEDDFNRWSARLFTARTVDDVFAR